MSSIIYNKIFIHYINHIYDLYIQSYICHIPKCVVSSIIGFTFKFLEAIKGTDNSLYYFGNFLYSPNQQRKGRFLMPARHWSILWMSYGSWRKAHHPKWRKT